MKLNEVKVGETIIADGGFTCMKAGPKTVEADDGGLYIRCDDGKHYLDGQEDREGADLVGLSKSSSCPAESV